MSHLPLDRLRVLFEECEALEKAAVAELSQTRRRSHRSILVQDHRVAKAFDAIRSRAKTISAILPSAADSISHVDSFYDALTELMEYHRKYPDAPKQPPPAQVASGCLNKVDDVLEHGFSGEERWGKYLDLHSFHARYQNIISRPMSYRAYLDAASQFHLVPQRAKGRQYAKYVRDLRDYLVDFKHRAVPLTCVRLDALKNNFESAWSSGTLLGWQAKKKTSAPTKAIALSDHDSAASLEALGLDALKSALQARGLKCGGSAAERAARLFAVKGLSPQEYPGKLKAKKRKSRGGGGAQSGSGQKALALAEYEVQHLFENDLRDRLDATKTLLTKRQTQSHEEFQAELLEGDISSSDLEEDDDDDPAIYNPLNVPLGWDGKPIPFWLYKLHGLGTEYKCEICGNFSYWGRRSFDFHFKGWRHSNGMRCLGIPNTKHFHGIVLIEDALKLWEGLSTRGVKEKREEEVEDADGNVLTRRVYDDLLRQGLL